MKIPTSDEIIDMHKNIVTSVIDDLIKQLTLPNGVWETTIILDDEEAALIIHALEDYRKRYE